MTPSHNISRREAMLGLLSVLGGVGIAGCESIPPSATSSSSPSDSPSRSVSGTPTETRIAQSLPRTKPWVARPAEVEPAAKLRATRLVELACAWDAGESGLSSARRRIVQSGYRPELVRGLTPLLPEGVAARVEVENAQYGGILPTSASVLMVVNQWVLGQNDRVKAGGTSLDVRLILNSSGWNVTDVRPARPRPPSSQLSSAARRVLSNKRIALPPAAHRDIESGAISDSVLLAMLELARRYRYDVSVLQSGHPIRVFGTDRLSNHTDGNAVDVCAINGHPVIDRRYLDTVIAFMESAADAGPYQVGGPANLDGAGTLFFADNTHQDHVHLGFS